MNVRLILMLFAFVFVAAPNHVNAQNGEFDDLILDGGPGGGPFIRFEQLDGDQDFIVAFDNRMDFYVSNGYKFKIYESAGSNSLTLDSSGVNVRNRLNVDLDNTGLGGPAVLINHLNGQSFGLVTLDEMSSINGGGIGFVTDSNPYPFFVFDSALEESLSIRAEGVGVGTYNAEELLHVYADGFPFSMAKILIENDLPTVANREMFELVNNGGSRFSFADTSRNSKWTFASDAAGRFTVSRNDTGGPELIVQSSGRVLMGPGSSVNFDLRPSGNLFLTGTLFQSSDENLKTAFDDVDASKVLAKVAQMPIQSWQFKADHPDQRHIGPTSQDFQAAFNLGPDETTIAPVDGIGVSLVAIKALHSQLEQKNKQVARLTDQVANQRQRLDQQQRLLEELSQRLDQLQQKDRELVVH